MAKPMKADDILLLVGNLKPEERVRLIRLMTEQCDIEEAAVYTAVPPRGEEFSVDEESLGWEAEDWETKD